MNKGDPCIAALQELAAVLWAQVLAGGSLASACLQPLPSWSAASAGQKGLQDRDAQILRLEEATVMNESALLHNTGHESYSALSPSCGQTKAYFETKNTPLWCPGLQCCKMSRQSSTMTNLSKHLDSEINE